MGPHGTFDTAGNVKEWTLNASGDNRWVLGGGWDDPTWMFSLRFASPPFDRSAQNGMRGASYPGGAPGDGLFGPVELLPRNFRQVTPVSDETFEVIRSRLAYVPSELDAALVEADSSAADWTQERIRLNTGTGETFDLALSIPRSATPPYQVVIYFPGLTGFQAPTPWNPGGAVASSGFLMGDLVRSGRVLAWPDWKGGFDRWDDFLSRSGDQYMRGMEERLGEWASELGRTVDYLESREDIDPERIAFYGVSFGASTPVPLLALERRLRAALLYLGGYSYREALPSFDPVNFVPRITMPVLLLGGSSDWVFPIETVQLPFLEHLGTPPAARRHRVYNVGHAPPPRSQFLTDVLPWLDEYVGPVR